MSILKQDTRVFKESSRLFTFQTPRTVPILVDSFSAVYATDIAVDPEGGRIFVVSNKLYVYDYYTKTLITTISGSFSGIAVDEEGGRILLTQGNRMTVLDYTTLGVIYSTSNLYGYPRQISIDKEGEKIFIAASGSRAIFIIDYYDYTTINTISSLGNVYGVCPDKKSGKIYAGNYTNRQVFEIDYTTLSILNTYSINNVVQISINRQNNQIWLGAPASGTMYIRKLSDFSSVTSTGGRRSCSAFDYVGNQVFVGSNVYPFVYIYK